MSIRWRDLTLERLPVSTRVATHVLTRGSLSAPLPRLAALLFRHILCGTNMTARKLFDLLYGGAADGGPLLQEEQVRTLVAQLNRRLLPLSLRIVGRAVEGYTLRDIEEARALVGGQGWSWRNRG